MVRDVGPKSPLLEETQRERSAFATLKGTQKTEGSCHAVCVGDTTLLAGPPPAPRAPEKPRG